MTEQRWEELVHRLERMAAQRPGAYRTRVGLLAALGFGYIGLVLVGLVVVIAAIAVLAVATTGVILKFAWPLLVLVFVLLRALWFRLPDPEGVSVGRDEAPALWALVDETRKRLDAPKIHRLLLDDQFNAGVVQVPRLGVMGPSRNFLVVGLPLLQALSEPQFAAVLAHEFGHLSGNHSRFAGWIYRLRRTYARVLEALEERQSRGIGLFRRFFMWYSPYFAAYSFALARQDEYVADRAAAEATAPEVAAGALVRGDLTGHWLQSRYWPELHRRAEREPDPPRNAFTSLGRRLPLPDDAADEEVVKALLAERTGTADTHPALADRLRGLGVSEEEAVAAGRDRPERSAATALLGDGEDELLARFDERYRESVAASWREAHEAARAARERYDELRAAEPTDADELVDLALLTARFEDEDAALPRFEAALEADPQHPVASFWVGRARLGAGDASGLDHLDRAIEHDPDAVIPSCELAYAFLAERGDEARAERYRERAERHVEEVDAATAERADVAPGDPLEHHGLPEEIVDRLRAVLAEERSVKRGYLVRKAMRHFPDRAPVYLVAVRASRWRDQQKLIDRLVPEIELPGAFFAVTLVGRYRRFKKSLAEIPGAEVYRRGRRNG